MAPETEQKNRFVIAQDDPRLIKLSFEEAAKIKPGITQNFIDHWWVTVDDHVIFWSPTGRVTYSYPQCNRNEGAIRHSFVERMYPWAIAKKIPVVCVKYVER